MAFTSKTLKEAVKLWFQDRAKALHSIMHTDSDSNGYVSFVGKILVHVAPRNKIKSQKG